jgi:hypothetical protein
MEGILKAKDRVDYVWIHDRYGRMIQIESGSLQQGARIRIRSDDSLGDPIGFVTIKRWTGPH